MDPDRVRFHAYDKCRFAVELLWYDTDHDFYHFTLSHGPEIKPDLDERYLRFRCFACESLLSELPIEIAG